MEKKLLATKGYLKNQQNKYFPRFIFVSYSYHPYLQLCRRRDQKMSLRDTDFRNLTYHYCEKRPSSDIQKAPTQFQPDFKLQKKDRISENCSLD